MMRVTNYSRQKLYYIFKDYFYQLDHGKCEKIVLVFQKEKGCVSYQLFKQVGTKDNYAMIEEWSSMADLEAHGKSDHVAKFGELQKENVTPDVRVYTLVEFEWINHSIIEFLDVFRYSPQVDDM